MALYSSHYPLSQTSRASIAGLVRFYFRLRVSGRENLPQDGAFILAANHNSHLDTGVLFSALPPRLRPRVVAAAARDYFFTGGYRQALVRVLSNAVPVDRDTLADRDPLRHVVRALHQGYGVVLYPEGTRGRRGEVGPFRRGIGRLLAACSDIPVVPVWISGTGRALPKGSWFPLPYTVRVRFGEPVYLTPRRTDRVGWQAAADSVRSAVLQLETVAG
jgi:1-acyl-sn-glycerol-3-phosphate acyltransferase